MRSLKEIDPDGYLLLSDTAKAYVKNMEKPASRCPCGDPDCDMGSQTNDAIKYCIMVVSPDTRMVFMGDGWESRHSWVTGPVFDTEEDARDGRDAFHAAQWGKYSHLHPPIVRKFDESRFNNLPNPERHS